MKNKEQQSIGAGNCKQKETKQKPQNLCLSSSTLASFIYYTFSNNQGIKKYLKQIKEKIKQTIQNQSLSHILEQQEQQNCHISLSRVFRLYRKQKQLLINAIKKQLSTNFGSNYMIPVIFSNLTVIGGRFITIQVHKGGVSYQRLNKITDLINKILVKWKIQPYFQSPIFHITLFKIRDQNKLQDIIPDDPKQSIKQRKNIHDQLCKRIQVIKIKNICFNCKQLCIKLGNTVIKLL